MLPITGPVSQIGVYDTDSVNSSLPEQNARHFQKDIFKCIFLNENIWISIKISLKFVPKGSINHISALVQIMDWHRLGDKPLSEPMLNQFTDAYMRHYVEMSLKKICPRAVRIFVQFVLFYVDMLNNHIWFQMLSHSQ